MSLLVNRELILAKIEPTPGTDSVPVVGTDAMLVENISTNLEGLRMADRPAVRQSIGKLQSVYAGSLRKVTFDVEMKGANATYAAAVFPEIDPLLRACGLSATLVDTVSWTYQVISVSHEYITLYYKADGIQYILTGCVGNPVFKWEAGTIAKISFEFTGHSVAPTDVALGTPVYDSHVPPVVVNSTFTVGGYAAVINAMTLDLGNIIATPPSVAASDGYALPIITGRDVQGSFDPESTLIATNDYEGDLRAGTQLTIIIGDVGGTVTNKHKTTLSRAYLKDISPGDRDAVRVYDIPFGCDNSSDDELVLLFD